MIRHISVTALATCPISIAMAYAQSFLRLAEAGGAEAIVVAGPLRRRVGVTFGSSTDTAEPGRSRDELRIRWSARSAWLPDFTGTLHFRIDSVETTMLRLDGSYSPPGGAAGRLFDELLGRRISDATAGDFVRRIARDLERREAEWQRRVDPAAIGANR
jgi:hypothetical protein